jgi:hypothetical protein
MIVPTSGFIHPDAMHARKAITCQRFSKNRPDSRISGLPTFISTSRAVLNELKYFDSNTAKRSHGAGQGALKNCHCQLTII